jgi:hypothetical protein
MRTNKLWLCFLIGTLAINCMRADVIVHDAKLITGNFPYPTTMLVTINMDGGLGVNLNDLGAGRYEFTTGLIGADYSLFPSTSGQEFTPLQAGGGGILVPGTSTQLFSLNETKQYAYWEDNVFSGGFGPDSHDNYGWVSLTRTVSGLVITDSATAIGGGIIVGTYTQIPEPATVLLFGLGGIGAWLLRRNGRAPAEPF